VAEQLLQGEQVGAAFEQVGGVAVPQRVHAGLLGDAGGPHGLAAEPLRLADAQVAPRRVPRKQPGVRAIASPVVAQAFEQERGQRHQAVLAALGGADVQEQALGVDIADVQADDLGDAQAGGVGGLQEQAIAEVADGGEQASDLVGAQDGGQGLGLLAVGDGDDDVGALQGEAVEQAQGTGGLVEAAPGDLVCEQVQLVEARVFGVELLGGAAEVCGEASDGRYLTGDGAWGVVAQLQAVEEALA
jgi:hypothetical protein